MRYVDDTGLRPARQRAAPLLFASVLLVACGARTGLQDDDASRPLDASTDLFVPDAPDMPRDMPLVDAFDAGTDAPDFGPDIPDFGPDAPDLGCIPASDGCGGVERCGNGTDDDCNGFTDELCPCEPGLVQPCFAGPPGRRGVGICTDGTQTCTAARTWGACRGGIVPMPDICNGADNLCDGCSARRDCPISCPSPGDPRVPDGMPFTAYPLRGGDFYPGMAASWTWSVQGGPCDAFTSGFVSFTLDGSASQNATLTPKLSGDYTITLRVITVEGTVLGCTWVVHVRGPGLRVEMCYPESATQDLDLFIQRTSTASPWYVGFAPTAMQPTHDSCGWHDCEAMIRGTGGRADWGYATSAIAECSGGPHGPDWAALGACSNPRLDVDNNLTEGVGLPENINLDVPREGDAFRIMVQNWSGLTSTPLVNVYCGGTRVATFGASPDTVPGYMGPRGDVSVGAMWRVADVTVHVDASTGETSGCDVEQLHRPGATSGYDVTIDDPRF